MNTFSSTDLISLLTIALYLAVASFALYLPLAVLLKDKEKALLLSIPISWSAQILFGYVFYCFALTNYYFFAYLLLVLAANLAAARRLKEKRKLPKIDFSNRTFVLAAIALFLVGLYYRFYDSIKFIADGNPDATSHLIMLRQIWDSGFLLPHYYAPGFHILLSPLGYLVPQSYDIMRFAGPVIGTLTLIGIYLLFKNRLRGISKLFLIAIFSFPLMARFSIQTIGFFPSALTFLYLAALLYLALDQKIAQRKKLYIMAVLVVGVATTVPYFLFKFAVFLLAAYAIASLTNRKGAGLIKRQLKISLGIVFLGIIVSFGHVLLQTKIVHESRFPQIRRVVKTSDELTIEHNPWLIQKYNKYCQENNRSGSKIFCNDLSATVLIPMISAGVDAISPKDALPPKSPIGSASYAITFLGLVIAVYSLKKRSRSGFLFGSGVFAYGVMTTTGLFEMSDYRGRGGWYFSFLTLLVVAGLFDRLGPKMPLWLCRGVIIALTIFALAKPLTIPRLGYPEMFIAVKAIAREESRDIALISNEKKAHLIAENIKPLEYSASNLKNDYQTTVLIVEKKLFDYEGELEKMIFSRRKDTEKANPGIGVERRESFERNTQKIKGSPEFQNYSLYWENENIEVYVNCNSSKH